MRFGSGRGGRMDEAVVPREASENEMAKPFGFGSVDQMVSLFMSCPLMRSPC